MTSTVPVPHHLVLVGMMGTGKSTMGRRAAMHLGRPFVDSDDEIVARQGRSVADIFATDGEPAFREIEATVMTDLLQSSTPSIIAAAGGSILREQTREQLRQRAVVVWLKASVDVLLERTSRGTHRPSLANDPKGTLHKMEHDRSALYAEIADVVVDSSQTKEAVVAAIVEAGLEVAIQ